jgi:SAM-dependent methyltransferase
MKLVCPVTLQPLEQAGDALVSGAYTYPVKGAVPDLRPGRDFDALRHHRRRNWFGLASSLYAEWQRRGIVFEGVYPFAVGSYEEELSGKFSGTTDLVQRAFNRYIRHRSRSLQEKLLNRALSLIPAPPHIAQIDFLSLPYGPHLGQSFSLLLAKRLFWDRLEILPDAIEIGSHNGKAAAFLWDTAKFAFGIEYVHSTLVDQGNFYDHGRVISGDIFALPFADGTVGAIYSNQSIPCCYGSIADLLREVRRVLKQGGTFAFTSHGPAWTTLMKGDCGLGSDVIDASTSLAFNDIRSSYMNFMYSREEWGRLLADYGFELISEQGYGMIQTSRIVEIFRTFENCGLGLLAEKPQFAGKMNDLFNRLLQQDVSTAPSGKWVTSAQVDFGLVARKL